jgi:peptidoglycan hydrolase-like protein with peptidoglycan-binding domain
MALQQELLSKGYNIGATKVDGKFGKNTQAAVTKYI